MLLKKKEIGKDSTFTSFNITNKKSNIASKVEKMNLTEYNDIKIFTSTFLPSHIKNNNLLKKNIEKIHMNRNLHFPLIKKSTKNFSFKNKKIKFKLNPSFSNIKNKRITPAYTNNNLIRKSNLSLNHKFKSEKRIDNHKINAISKGNNKIIFDNKYNIYNPPLNIKNNFIPNQFKTFINDNKNKNNNNKSFKNITSHNNYFITSNNKILNNNKINNEKKLFQTKSFFSKNKKYKSPVTLEYNYLRTLNNSNSNIKKKNDIYKIKKNLNYWKLLEIEKNFSNAYDNNLMSFNEKTKLIKQIKEKCKIILEEIDKKNNYAIQLIIKEIKEQLLGLGFKEFYRYLLTILKNYDKKIVNWSFDIVEEKKGCPEELKLKNVRKRHQKFMGMLNRQYVDGINLNNQMDYLIKNSKYKLGFNNNDNYDKIFVTNINNNDNQNKYMDNICTQGNYRSKYYERFLGNNNNI